MASQYLRLLTPTNLPASFKQPDPRVADLGAFKTLEVFLRILKVGPAGQSVFLEHNATLDPDNWRAIAGATLAQNGTDIFVPVDHFLRYVRVAGSAGGDNSCIAMCDIVAKD